MQVRKTVLNNVEKPRGKRAEIFVGHGATRESECELKILYCGGSRLVLDTADSRSYKALGFEALPVLRWLLLDMRHFVLRSLVECSL